MLDEVSAAGLRQSYRRYAADCGAGRSDAGVPDRREEEQERSRL